MLEPQLYPELVARALVLDPEPFEAMHDDDNPWVEGLALTAIIGMAAGLAQAIGGWLTINSLPDPNTVQNALVEGVRQLATVVPIPQALIDALQGTGWSVLALLTGYAGGWSSFTPLAATPISVIFGWLFFGVIAYGTARALGGHGTLNQTLGATALMVAPQVLLWLTIIPFVVVSSALLSVWAVLIGYRAVQITHHLSWQRAAIATLVPVLAAGLLAALLGGAFALGLTAGGLQ